MTRGAQRAQPCPASEDNAKTQPQKDPRSCCPSPHTKEHEGLCCRGPLSPTPLGGTASAGSSSHITQGIYDFFSRLKYGLLPRTGRRRRVPANLLIYKSIWQGAINSFPTVGCAEGGVSPPLGRAGGSPHQPCPAEPNSFCAQQPRPTPSPSLGALTGTSNPNPPQPDPLQVTPTAPPARSRGTAPKPRFIGGK